MQLLDKIHVYYIHTVNLRIGIDLKAAGKF